MKKLNILAILFIVTVFSANAQDFWQQIGQDVNGDVEFAVFSTALCMSSDGNTYAAQHRNYIKIYRNISGNWELIGDSLFVEANSSDFASYISLNADGSIIIIGSSGHDNSDLGYTKIYKYNGTDWEQIGQTLFNDNAVSNSDFGACVSINNDGTIIAIGDFNFHNGTNWFSSVNVYQYMSNTWSLVADTIYGSGNITSVSLNSDGTTLAIGMPNGDGLINVYQNISNTWQQVGQDIVGGSNEKIGDNLSLSGDGSTLIVGTIYYNNYAGKAVVYKNISNIWQQFGLTILGGGADYHLGESVDINYDGSIIAVGVPYNPSDEIGLVKVYKIISNVWQQVGQDILGKFEDDQSGTYVCISSDGSTVSIGAPRSYGEASGPGYNYYGGQVRVYSFCGTISYIETSVCDSYTLPSGSVVTESGNYIDTIINNAGCDSIINIELNKLEPRNQQICLVTVDPTIGKNKIVWEYNDTDVETFIIQKEISSNIYSAIATINVDEPYEYIDYGSDPMSHSDLYKITVIDTCGNQSDIDSSVYHKTINLTLSNVGSTMSLNWEQYEVEDGSFVPPLYYIYRGTTPDNLQLIDSVTGSIHSYNDLNISQVYYYMIGTKRDNCGSTKSINSTYEIFSNKKDNIDLISVPELDVSNQINIYPNPAHNQLTITNEKLIIESIEITDITGKIIKQLKINNLELKIKIEDFENGVYLIKIKTAEASFVKQFVKE